MTVKNSNRWTLNTFELNYNAVFFTSFHYGMLTYIFICQCPNDCRSNESRQRPQRIRNPDQRSYSY